jgi:hypothetical protein
MQVFGGDVADLELRCERIELGVCRVHAVDPQQCLLRVDGIGELIEWGVVVRGNPVAVQPRPDHRASVGLAASGNAEPTARSRRR